LLIFQGAIRHIFGGDGMDFRIAVLAASVAGVGLGASGCSTWDKLDESEKGTVIGAGVGGAAGAAVSDGGVLGTAAGAAIGGVVGHEVGRRQEKDD
jgi:osmotically inducible lipoprotein OsmB